MGVGGFKNMLEVQMRAQTEPFEWMKGWMLMKWLGRGGSGEVSENPEDERLVCSVAEHLSCVSLARALLKLAEAKVNIPNMYLISDTERSGADSERRNPIKTAYLFPLICGSCKPKTHSHFC